MRARDLAPGARLAGFLPPVKGIRARRATPIVHRARRRNDRIVVTWVDGTKAYYFADSVVELAP